MKFAKPKINTNWLLLIAAVGLGIGAVLMSNSLIKNRVAELEAAANKGRETVAVVVAKRDLERGEPITSAVVAVRQIPKEFVHESAIRPEQFAGVERQRLSVPIKRGETLLSMHTEGNGANVFSATLRKGLRALTFEVDAVNSISGLLRPGDRIDLIYSAKDGSEETARPLLSNVAVLATDQTLTKRDEATGKERSFSTVTLELSPLDADRVIVAKAAGRLTALLRNPDDEALNRTAALSAASLAGNGNGTDGRVIEYIFGGGSGKADVQLTRAVSALGAH